VRRRSVAWSLLPPLAVAASSTASPRRLLESPDTKPSAVSAAKFAPVSARPTSARLLCKGGHIDQRFHALVAGGRVGDDRAAVGMTNENLRYRQATYRDPYFWSGIVKGLSLESTMKTAKRLAGSLSLAFSLIL
jgi:hypothetical protein